MVLVHPEVCVRRPRSQKPWDKGRRFPTLGRGVGRRGWRTVLGRRELHTPRAMNADSMANSRGSRHGGNSTNINTTSSRPDFEVPPGRSAGAFCYPSSMRTAVSITSRSGGTSIAAAKSRRTSGTGVRCPRSKKFGKGWSMSQAVASCSWLNPHRCRADLNFSPNPRATRDRLRRAVVMIRSMQALYGVGDELPGLKMKCSREFDEYSQRRRS